MYHRYERVNNFWRIVFDDKYTDGHKIGHLFHILGVKLQFLKTSNYNPVMKIEYFIQFPSVE